MIIDFHSHSHASDGALAPLELLQRAADAGVRRFAITDHDTVAGYQSLLAEAALPDIELVAAPDTAIATLRELARDVDAMAIRTALVPKEVLSAATNLKIVSRHGVGTDNVDVPYLSGRGIPVATD